MKNNQAALYGKRYFQGIYARLAKEKKEVLTSFFSLLSEKKPKIENILDLGCGEGEFLRVCMEYGIFSFGIDISDYALKIARDNSQAKLFKLDLGTAKLPFESNYFDTITCFDLLEHLSSPDLILSEAYRVLKPGGVFFITTPNAGMWLGKFLGLFFPGDETHVNVKKADYWRQRIFKAGFKKVVTKGSLLFGFPPGLDLRYLFCRLGIPRIIKPVFFPFLPLTSTLFIFSRKPPLSNHWRT